MCSNRPLSLDAMRPNNNDNMNNNNNKNNSNQIPSRLRMLDKELVVVLLLLTCSAVCGADQRASVADVIACSQRHLAGASLSTPFCTSRVVFTVQYKEIFLYRLRMQVSR